MITFKELLQRMLDRVPDTVDKREGSIIYDALAPVAAELVQTYIELDGYLDLVLLDTSSGEYLTRLCNQFGVERKSATHAIRKGIFDGLDGRMNVPIGSRYTLNTLAYIVIEKMSDGEYKLQCESSGTIGNTSFGKLVPVDYIDGLVTATLEDVIIPGEAEESDSNLRGRLKSKIHNSAQDGNSARYLEWASEYSGIGKARVFPLWNGGNTVKISITSADNTPASEQLIKEFQEYIDPNSEGLGEGKAPIGAKVTVATGNIKTIDISADVVLEEGYKDPEGASTKIVEYLRDITYRQSYVSYFFIGNILVGLDSIYDIKNLRMNGASSDVELEEEDIPTLGSLKLTVMT